MDNQPYFFVPRSTANTQSFYKIVAIFKVENFGEIVNFPKFRLSKND